jgi:hypothetical protein
MTEGDKHGLLYGLESALACVSPLTSFFFFTSIRIGAFTQHVPWLARILSFLSITKDTSKEFRQFLERTRLEFDDAKAEQEDNTSNRKDLFYHLVSSFQSTPIYICFLTIYA